MPGRQAKSMVAVVFASFLLLAQTGTVAARSPQGKPFGLGLSLGEPLGLSAKWWIDQKSAIDMAFGYGYFPHSGPALFADYVYHVFTIVRPRRVPFYLELYMGAGAKLGFWYYRWYRDKDHWETRHGFGFGIRFPVGLSMNFTKAPFDVFLELVPAMSFITPDPVFFDFDGAIGGRFYF